MIATHKQPIVYQISNVAATFAHSAALLFNIQMILTTETYLEKTLNVLQIFIGSLQIMISLYNYNFQKRVRKLSQERASLILNYLIKMSVIILIGFAAIGLSISHLISKDQDSSSTANYMSLLLIVVVFDLLSAGLLVNQRVKISRRLNKFSKLSPSIDEMELYAEVAQSLYQEEIEHQKLSPLKSKGSSKIELNTQIILTLNYGG
ncbi:UNKNOWN [Stylonychia lemnae]|uniref:Uncharacterized protein n=1 Tax=Stylonychia lemnae TaxID=5949 RepID=A0A078APT8_STYLE|nr:UNKNOWN [Stylonychia lemnae]|eukprot:CDW84179.1 UNKNOWN [Stylonychia lemnae]